MATTTTCAVGERDRQVILSFPHPVDFAAFDPETARRIAEAIAKAAYKAHTGSDAGDGKMVITETLRERMILNITHMVRSMTDKHQKPSVIARHVTDYILTEVS